MNDKCQQSVPLSSLSSASVHSVLTVHAFPSDPVGPFATLHPFPSTTLSFPFSALSLNVVPTHPTRLSVFPKKPSPASISLLRNVWIRFFFVFVFYLFVVWFSSSFLSSKRTFYLLLSLYSLLGTQMFVSKFPLFSSFPGMVSSVLLTGWPGKQVLHKPRKYGFLFGWQTQELEGNYTDLQPGLQVQVRVVKWWMNLIPWPHLFLTSWRSKPQQWQRVPSAGSQNPECRAILLYRCEFLEGKPRTAL